MLSCSTFDHKNKNKTFNRSRSHQPQQKSDLSDQGSPDLTDLCCGRRVPTSLYISVINRVMDRHAELKPGIPYTLKMICGESYWNGLGSLRNAAGWLMAELVDAELVPYLFASERDAKPLWYRLKP